MPTGDGLLARLRPETGAFSPAQLIALAEAAALHGNGLIEITSRGSLQVRGLQDDTAPLFADAVRTAGIGVASGLGIETSPLAGLDPADKADPLPLAAAIRAYCSDLAPSLAPKFALVIDGGAPGLTSSLADIRLEAADSQAWAITIGGRQRGLLDAPDVPMAVRRALFALAAKGPAARGRDLPEDFLLPGLVSGTLPSAAPETPAIGARPTSIGNAFGIGLPYGQIEAPALIAIARLAEALGARDLRPAPHHVLLVTGLGRFGALRRQAAELGLVTELGDPRRSVAACPGAPRCASGHLATKTLAEALLAVAPDLLAGLDLHVSGCLKGCAHPRPAALALVGEAGCVAVLHEGAALGVVRQDEILDAVSRLDTLYRDNRQAGETSESVLARLGRARLSAALSPER